MRPDRRNVLRMAANGFGAVALESMLQRNLLSAATPPLARVNPLAPKAPHFAGKAKSVIFLFMVGAPGQMDTFDPKPDLKKWEGKPLPESFWKDFEPVHQGRHADSVDAVGVQALRPERTAGVGSFPQRGAMR